MATSGGEIVYLSVNFFKGDKLFSWVLFARTNELHSYQSSVHQSYGQAIIGMLDLIGGTRHARARRKTGTDMVEGTRFLSR